MGRTDAGDFLSSNLRVDYRMLGVMDRVYSYLVRLHTNCSYECEVSLRGRTSNSVSDC